MEEKTQMKKYVYMFPEGNGSMRELLGGKGANMAEMTGIGIRAFGRARFHAWHDGYHPQPRHER